MEVIEKHVDALDLFDEKADKLPNSAFVDTLLSPKTGVKISGREQENGSFEISSEVGAPAIRMFSSISKECPMILDEALKQVDALPGDPQWLEQGSFIGFVNILWREVRLR